MKNKKNMIFAAVLAVVGLFLSCSLDPYGEGLGVNSTGGDTSILITNIEIDGGGGGVGNCTKPSVPSGVSASAQSSSSIRISWNSVSGASSYRVYRATSASGNYSYVTTVYSATYTNTGLSSSTTYYYKVSAVNSCGESGYSSYASATTTGSSCTKPSAPSNVSASANFSRSIRISWNSVSGATYYNIYRATSASGTYSLVGYVSSSSTSYTNSGLSSGTTYYYRVTAENSCGESALSTSYDYATAYYDLWEEITNL